MAFIARLAELPQIAGLKDATGDPSRVARLRILLGTDFRLFSGDDATALTFIAQGGDGCVSVTSNVGSLSRHVSELASGADHQSTTAFPSDRPTYGGFVSRNEPGTGEI